MRRAELAGQLVSVVIEGGNGMLPHQVEEPGLRHTCQLGGLAESQAARSNLFEQPEEAQLLRDLLRIQGSAAKGLLWKIDLDTMLLQPSSTHGQSIPWVTLQPSGRQVPAVTARCSATCRVLADMLHSV